MFSSLGKPHDRKKNIFSSKLLKQNVTLAGYFAKISNFFQGTGNQSAKSELAVKGVFFYIPYIIIKIFLVIVSKNQFIPVDEKKNIHFW